MYFFCYRILNPLYLNPWNAKKDIAKRYVKGPSLKRYTLFHFKIKCNEIFLIKIYICLKRAMPIKHEVWQFLFKFTPFFSCFYYTNTKEINLFLVQLYGSSSSQKIKKLPLPQYRILLDEIHFLRQPLPSRQALSHAVFPLQGAQGHDTTLQPES